MNSKKIERQSFSYSGFLWKGKVSMTKHLVRKYFFVRENVSFIFETDKITDNFNIWCTFFLIVLLVISLSLFSYYSTITVKWGLWRIQGTDKEHLKKKQKQTKAGHSSVQRNRCKWIICLGFGFFFSFVFQYSFAVLIKLCKIAR